MAETCNQFPASILAVIVLYRTHLNNSTAFQTLQAAISNFGEQQAICIQVLLYDNTPEAHGSKHLPEFILYKAAPRNEGIAGAYNYALDLALSEDYTWLLTLDQDTNLPPDFIVQMSEIALRLHAVDTVGAIVPQLFHGDELLSPVCIRPWGVHYLPRGFRGIAKRETHAFNSGSLFRVAALKQIGGFHPYFWLDYQDAYVYRQLHRCGRKVHVAGHIEVQHDLSLLSGEAGFTPDRFRNFLQAESTFLDLYGTHTHRVAHTLRLLGRLWRQQMRGDDSAIRQLTGTTLKQRLFQSRTTRIRNWKTEMEHRMLSPASVEEDEKRSEQRPSISVCMAAYNGERYITAQLESILSQLEKQDEVIVVDDASKDGTRNSIRALGDRRIRLIEHGRNLGVSRTFEDAIRAASGGILFLSDQDDIWNPRKVQTILEAFRSHPDVALIATDAALIDSNDSLISPSYFAGRGKFRPGLWANLRQNWFGGCTMAFRAELIADILPLPHKYEVLHDLWIGVRSSLSGHRSLFIDEPLVLNRRHSTTTTGRTHRTTIRKLQYRLDLLLALVEFRIHKMTGSGAFDKTSPS